ncbi:hypothetical protein GGX14DRAFT_483562 [Mycena pura]|uniref:Uncharacterized protein n=1 Tax=Mycena pura TaxID=153505 RepID=A0AAD6ULL5_9AGAR|nr:hypothetical protein GGX14DRAFT_483562 [Mycena pura]
MPEAQWDAYTEHTYQQMSNEQPVPKPAWTFPSPFVAYSGGWMRGEKCWGPPPRTLAELRMYGLSWAIRSKPEWQRKILDPAILEKWRKEALDQQEGLLAHKKLTKNMVNYVLTELPAYAKISDPATGIESGPFDAIWFSDRLISDEIANRLRAEIVTLEDAEQVKDWHPGSNGQVLDLVHPSLYCIVYGRTRSVTRYIDASSSLTPVTPATYELSNDYSKRALSKRFCWLPSDFSVDANDGSVTLVSPYINNLHPTKHQSLYRVIESILSSFVPLFERVLSQVNGQDKDLFRDVPPGSGRIKVERVFGTFTGYRMKFAGVAVPCIWTEGMKYQEDMTNDEYERLAEVLPEAHEEYAGALEQTIAPYSLRGKTIQCIIKLANIHLTPENPEYKGGSWHVEGMLNERIVASGIYYYEEENITESRLAFRVTTSAPVYHEQDDELCSKLLYGMMRDTHCVQDLGSLITSSRRAIAWPNIYQHRVQPFRLRDLARPGHRKILAIFLVDPSIDPIPSATTVPPQQAEWAFDALEGARGDPHSAFSRLPLELSEMIQTESAGDSLMKRSEAEEYRLALMKERTQSVQAHDVILSYSFNMCEH